MFAKHIGNVVKSFEHYTRTFEGSANKTMAAKAVVITSASVIFFGEILHIS